MTTVPKPAAEVEIDATLVRALLRAQHHDLAELPLVDIGSGWDNHSFRLGDALVVRLPRRALAVPLLENEQRWLPMVARGLPLPVPSPLRIGRADCGYPWPWSVVPWLDGERALDVIRVDPVALAADLGTFVRALHRPAPDDAPRSTWRGVPLAERTPTVRAHVERLAAWIDAPRVSAAWTALERTPSWAGPAVWLHGDLHPDNLLVANGRLSAVIDFGDITAGDPATDLSIAWMLLPRAARSLFRRAARPADTPVDDDTWQRARAWALALGLAYLANSADDRRLETFALDTIRAALDDGAVASEPAQLGAGL